MGPTFDQLVVVSFFPEGRGRGEFGADASYRRAVFEVSILRLAPDGLPVVARRRPRGGHRVRWSMRLMGLEATTRPPRTSDPHPAHRIYHYLLRGASRPDSIPPFAVKRRRKPAALRGLSIISTGARSPLLAGSPTKIERDKRGFSSVINERNTP